jgi:hypothetical protein
MVMPTRQAHGRGAGGAEARRRFAAFDGHAQRPPTGAAGRRLSATRCWATCPGFSSRSRKASAAASARSQWGCPRGRSRGPRPPAPVSPAAHRPRAAFAPSAGTARPAPARPRCRAAAAWGRCLSRRGRRGWPSGPNWERRKRDRAGAPEVKKPVARPSAAPSPPMVWRSRSVPWSVGARLTIRAAPVGGRGKIRTRAINVEPTPGSLRSTPSPARGWPPSCASTGSRWPPPGTARRRWTCWRRGCPPT